MCKARNPRMRVSIVVIIEIQRCGGDSKAALNQEKDTAEAQDNNIYSVVINSVTNKGSVRQASGTDQRTAGNLRCGPSSQEGDGPEDVSWMVTHCVSNCRLVVPDACACLCVVVARWRPCLTTLQPSTLSSRLRKTIRIVPLGLMLRGNTKQGSDGCHLLQDNDAFVRALNKHFFPHIMKTSDGECD